jgi:HSP20 family molecular chaperone IbpA
MNITNPQDEEKAVIAPLTDVTETGESICVTCQLQGIPEEEIRIDLERSQLTLYASKQNETYLQKITVPEGSRIIKKKFRDGILEIMLKRPS